MVWREQVLGRDDGWKLTQPFFLLFVVCVFSTAAFGDYCSASGGGQQYISGVIVGNLVNTGTGSDGYVDYTGMSTNIAVGESNSTTIFNGLSIAGSQCGIWVDWNENGDFGDACEVIVVSGGPMTFTATITAPSGTTSGDKRMRVRIMGPGSLVPCGSTTYGEVEDYTIAVVSPWTGSGDANDPYQIWTAEDMQEIGADANYWDAHFELMADIDLVGYIGTSFNIIGTYPNPFTGVFDGNGHTISNFTHATNDTWYIGLFGYVSDANATIKDLTLVTPDVNAAGVSIYVGCLVGRLESGRLTGCGVKGGGVMGYGVIGGLVGKNTGTISGCYGGVSVTGYSHTGGLAGGNGGTISNCYGTGSVTCDEYGGGLVGRNWGTISNCHGAGIVTGSERIGGLVGDNYEGRISNCYAAGSVAGDYHTGGLAGRNDSGTILNCYGAGSVTGITHTGGLVGGNYEGTILSCYAAGSVTGDYHTGGFVGWNEGRISNCYATGSVSGAGLIGGLVGCNYEGRLSNCYAAGVVTGTGSTSGLVGYDSRGSYTSSFWDRTVNPLLAGIGNISDPPGVIGESTINMKKKTTFTNVGWDFVYIWDICDGTNYPKLAWQFMLGDFVCGDGVDFNDLDVFVQQWLMEKLSADVAAGGGDGIVDFVDWAVLADGWQNTVGLNDVADFAEQWLQFGAYCADIAPSPGGDGVVDMLDFAVLAGNWLEGQIN